MVKSFISYMCHWFNWVPVLTTCSSIVTKFGYLALFQNVLKSNITTFFEMIFLKRPGEFNIVVKFIRDLLVLILKM